VVYLELIELEMACHAF